MKCEHCDRPHHGRNLCRHHYGIWYRANRDEAKRITAPKQRKWKFTPKHWWNWWEARRLDQDALKLRAEIDLMRQRLR